MLRRNYENGWVSAEKIKTATVDFVEYYNSTRPQVGLRSLSPDEYLSQNKNGTAIVLRTEDKIA